MSGLHTYTCFKDAESHKSLGISVQFSDTCLTSESTPSAPLRDNDLPITSTINVHVKSARNVESSDRLRSAIQHTQTLARGKSQPFVGHVYLLRAGEFVKIGVADDVEARIARLQGGCPFPS